MRAIHGHVGFTKVEARGGGQGARAPVLLFFESGSGIRQKEPDNCRQGRDPRLGLESEQRSNLSEEEFVVRHGTRVCLHLTSRVKAKSALWSTKTLNNKMVRTGRKTNGRSDSLIFYSLTFIHLPFCLSLYALPPSAVNTEL